MADFVVGEMAEISSIRTVTFFALARIWRIERAMSGPASEAVAT